MSSNEIHLTLPTPHKGQRLLLAERRRFNAVACGRRWGKTKFASLELVANKALDGLPCGWFAPSFKILDDAWREMSAALAPVKRSSNAGTHRLELLTGGSIECWSLKDPDAGRSRKYAIAAIDEAGLVKDLETRFYEAIRPTLSDLRGELWMFGTPKGRNFFATAFDKGQDPLEPDWASWQMPTSTNPYIAAEEIQAARLGMPDRAFRQEYLAEFIEDAGGVFRGVRDAVDAGVRERAPIGPVTLGVDLAKVEDFTVISGVDQSGRQVYFERFNQISWERQEQAIVSAWQKFPGSRVRIETNNQGDPMYERLKIRGVNVEPWQTTNASKEAIINTLAMLLENSRLRLLDIPEQTSELQAFEYQLTASRNVRMAAPAGMHDDTVIALALAAWDIREHTPSWGSDPGLLAELARR